MSFRSFESFGMQVTNLKKWTNLSATDSAEAENKQAEQKSPVFPVSLQAGAWL